MNVLQALWAAIRCTPIPPRNRRNRGVGNGAAAGTATRRGVNGAVGTRNINGLRGGGNGTTGITAATPYGTRNIIGLRGAGGAGNAGAAERKSVSFGDGRTLADKKKEEQSIRNLSGGSESLDTVSQHTASTANAPSYSIGEVGGGESQIEQEIGQEEMTEIEERMTIADEEDGMLDPTIAESDPVEGEQIDIDKDEETGVLKNDTALGPSYLK